MLATSLETWTNKSIIDEDCDKCKERKDNFVGIPPSTTLVQRLNQVSRKLEGYLNGSSWYVEIYTSDWVQVEMEIKKQKDEVEEQHRNKRRR